MVYLPSDLPASAQSAFNRNIHSPILWPSVVEAAVKAGVRDPDNLADIVFFLYNPDLIEKGGFSASHKDFQRLSAEWTYWRGLVKSAVPEWSKPAGPKEWEFFTKSHWSKSGAIADAVKDWLAKPPTHEREVGMFRSSRMDGSRHLYFLAWKTSNLTRHCKLGHSTRPDGHVTDSGALKGWIERSTTLDSVRRQHNIEYSWTSALGNDAGVKGIAAMNAGMNVFMFHYVMKKGLCAECAQYLAKKNMHLEAKAILDLVSKVVSGGTGAKLAPKVTPVSDVRIDKFAKIVYKVATGDYGRSADVDYGGDEIGYDEAIYGASGGIVGKVKYFD